MNFTVIKQMCVPFLLLNQFVSTCIAYDTLTQALNYLENQKLANCNMGSEEPIHEFRYFQLLKTLK